MLSLIRLECGLEETSMLLLILIRKIRRILNQEFAHFKMALLG
jgi:hypothetical protein